MEAVILELAKYAGTALITLGIAWLKKKMDLKRLKRGEVDINDL